MIPARRASIGDAALQAAIALWAEGAPLVTGVHPSRARAGEPVLLSGRWLAGAGLEVRFGRARSWAVSLSERSAVCYVPAGAGSPLSLSRVGPRTYLPRQTGSGGGDGPAQILRVDPLDGACGVLRDAPVLARASRPLDEASLTESAFRVGDPAGDVPARLRLSPDGLVAIWQPERRLRDCCEHEVAIAGLLDTSGAPVACYRGWFTTGTLTRDDLVAT